MNKNLLAALLALSFGAGSCFLSDAQTTNIISGVSTNAGLNFYVGQSTPYNYLEINSAGVLYDTNAYIGFSATASNNSALVTGNGSVWTNTFDLSVGHQGSGNSLVIANGGRVYDRVGYVGFGTSAVNNSALVTGTGSLWRNEGLGVGTSSHSNSLTIAAGGQVVSLGGMSVATDTGTFNNVVLVTGPGSLLYVGGDLNLGTTHGTDPGSGNRLTITAGAQLEMPGDPHIRHGGTFEVTGSGSVANISGQLTVGNPAGGQMIISNGGRVNCRYGFLDTSGDGITERALVTGTGSIWSNWANFIVGYLNDGNVLTVRDGGYLWSAGGRSYSGNNTILITGNGSHWEETKDWGFPGANNHVIVSNGATIHFELGSSAGAGNTSTNNRITVADGSLFATNATSTSGLAVHNGTVTMNGGLMVTDGLSMTYSPGRFFFNAGALYTKFTLVTNGQPFVVGDGIRAATLHLQGGSHTFSQGLNISSNGVLTGTGTIVGSVTNRGTIKPGSSPGALIVDGQLAMTNNSIFDIELGGTAQGVSYDFVHVLSNTALDGDLRVSFVNGFQGSVTASDVFTNLTADVSLLGAFDNVASGSRLDTADGFGSFLVTYDDGHNLILGDFLAAPIPEPSALLLLALGAVLLRCSRASVKRGSLHNDTGMSRFTEARLQQPNEGKGVEP